MKTGFGGSAVLAVFSSFDKVKGEVFVNGFSAVVPVPQRGTISNFTATVKSDAFTFSQENCQITPLSNGFAAISCACPSTNPNCLDFLSSGISNHTMSITYTVDSTLIKFENLPLISPQALAESSTKTLTETPSTSPTETPSTSPMPQPTVLFESSFEDWENYNYFLTQKTKPKEWIVRDDWMFTPEKSTIAKEGQSSFYFHDPPNAIWEWMGISHTFSNVQVAGKKLKATFWVKGKEDNIAGSSQFVGFCTFPIDAEAHSGKCFGELAKIDFKNPEWKQYTITAEIPETETRDILFTFTIRTGCELVLGLCVPHVSKNKEPTNVWLDDIIVFEETSIPKAPEGTPPLQGGTEDLYNWSFETGNLMSWESTTPVFVSQAGPSNPYSTTAAHGSFFAVIPSQQRMHKSSTSYGGFSLGNLQSGAVKFCVDYKTPMGLTGGGSILAIWSVSFQRQIWLAPSSEWIQACVESPFDFSGITNPSLRFVLFTVYGYGSSAPGELLLVDNVRFQLFPPCFDSDSGEEPFNPGGVIIVQRERNPTLVGDADYCVNDVELVEFYCSNDENVSKQVSCPNGCSNGACIGCPQNTPCFGNNWSFENGSDNISPWVSSSSDDYYAFVTDSFGSEEFGSISANSDDGWFAVIRGGSLARTVVLDVGVNAAGFKLCADYHSLSSSGSGVLSITGSSGVSTSVNVSSSIDYYAVDEPIIEWETACTDTITLLKTGIFDVKLNSESEGMAWDNLRIESASPVLLPDLIITSARIASRGISLLDSCVSFTVKNVGNTATPNLMGIFACYSLLGQVPCSVGSSAGTEVYFNLPALQPGKSIESRNISADLIKLPKWEIGSIASLLIDKRNGIQESNENNNYFNFII